MVCLALGAATTIVLAWVLAITMVVYVNQGGPHLAHSGEYEAAPAAYYDCVIKKRCGPPPRLSHT